MASKRPDIGKRLLPLLDIIMILLAFFIVLPHGIKSRELVQIETLKSKNQEMARKLAYYQWQYGTLKKTGQKVYRTLTITVSSNELYLDNQKVPPAQWPSQLQKRVTESGADFVMVQVFDVAGKYTERETITTIEKLLDGLQIIHIIETLEKRR